MPDEDSNNTKTTNGGVVSLAHVASLLHLTSQEDIVVEAQLVENHSGMEMRERQHLYHHDSSIPRIIHILESSDYTSSSDLDDGDEEDEEEWGPHSDDAVRSRKSTEDSSSLSSTPDKTDDEWLLATNSSSSCALLLDHLQTRLPWKRSKRRPSIDPPGSSSASLLSRSSSSLCTPSSRNKISTPDPVTADARSVFSRKSIDPPDSTIHSSSEKIGAKFSPRSVAVWEPKVRNQQCYYYYYSGGGEDSTDTTPFFPEDGKDKKGEYAAAGTPAGSNFVNTYKVSNFWIQDLHGKTGLYNGMMMTLSLTNQYPPARLPHGYGCMVYTQTECLYQGEWNYGRWSGRGRLEHCSSGDVYEGEFRNDRKHGRGLRRFVDGRVFDGVYQSGQMVRGTMTYTNGSVYTGDWKGGLRNGQGHYTFADGSVYCGGFLNGELSGLGRLEWYDGSWYEGEFSNGLMHGMGKEFDSKGWLRHEGEWFENSPV